MRNRKLIIGDPTIFAIESGITQAYHRLNFRALGFFVVHVNGQRYGVHELDGTMLACSFDEVERRIAHRGTHTAPFAVEPAAEKIAAAFLNAAYADGQRQSFFGIPLEDFTELFHRNGLVWAPDGDEAFDDDSHILQFDILDHVRVIAFRNTGNYAPTTLSEIWVDADCFYGVLQQWRDAFETEWKSLPKLAD
jgi:hypothetical protein